MDRDALALVAANVTREAAEEGRPLLIVGPRGYGILYGVRSETRPNAPFRAPHHTVSEQGLVGQWRYDRETGERQLVRQGEFQLAQPDGILLLDDVGEFRKSGIESLASLWRQTPENRRPQIVAVAYQEKPGRSWGDNYYVERRIEDFAKRFDPIAYVVGP